MLPTLMVDGAAGAVRGVAEAGAEARAEAGAEEAGAERGAPDSAETGLPEMPGLPGTGSTSGRTQEL